MRQKKLLRRIACAVIGLTTSLSTQAQFTGLGELNINNVRAQLRSDGGMFWDYSNPQFEVPFGSGKSTIFAGGVWIGGYDQLGQIHAAAQTYRQAGSQDFWPGPLDTINATAANPALWDQVWEISKSEIDNHILNWNQAGYVIPQSILDWPANAPSGTNYSKVLAPFIDINGNQIYEPLIGEFPYIQGDQALYFIYNDNYAAHTETGCNAMRIEVHGMAYEFNNTADPAINNTVFLRLEIGNRSNISYDSVYVGLWTDFDIGDYSDDYVGTDVGRSMYYGFNADADDGNCPGCYGLTPPAQGVIFLNQPLTTSVYYDNINMVPTGNPDVCDDYYQYLSGSWADGTRWTYGGNGYNPGSFDYCNYLFPDTTDPAYPGNVWTMGSAGVPPTDIRIAGASYYTQLPAGGSIVLDAAYTFAMANPSGPLTSVQLLQYYADQLRLAYNNGTLPVNNIQATNNQFIISPNPVTNQSLITFNNPSGDSFSFELFDMTGKKVFEVSNIKGNKFLLTRGHLTTGIYIGKLNSEKSMVTQKICIR